MLYHLIVPLVAAVVCPWLVACGAIVDCRVGLMPTANQSNNISATAGVHIVAALACVFGTTTYATQTATQFTHLAHTMLCVGIMGVRGMPMRVRSAGAPV